MSDLCWLIDEQMARLRPHFPKNHGRPHVDDQRVLSGIIFVNRNGLRWRDAPATYGPHKTLYVAGSDGARRALHPDNGGAVRQTTKIPGKILANR